MLVSLVRAICRNESATELVAAEGVVVVGKDGQQVRHPAAIVERGAAGAAAGPRVRVEPIRAFRPGARGPAVSAWPRPRAALDLDPGSRNSSAQTRAWEPLGGGQGGGAPGRLADSLRGTERTTNRDLPSGIDPARRRVASNGRDRRG